MTNVVRCALAALVVCTGACSDSALPTAPTPPVSAPAPAPAPPANPPRGFPDVSRPARVYVAVDWPASTYHGGQLASRYVLYDDRTFSLQYSSPAYPFFEYRGTYTEANGVITFDWEGWSVAGPWGAHGSITPERLVVAYNLVMILSDFEDGVYLRTQ